ncbi:hypothetical protein [Mannheimia pernigra]|uniref:hypothetical protein n=1 Tax=Mannheimia pernigra TaxID=111844 RepID=UPI00131680E3|nr:hypothetical protein [Mannheimia pernigra]QHB18250.1 hypothetical protein GM695_09560 [Mannheimia pernigra]
MAKTEFIGSAEVAKLLDMSATNLYGWISDDRRKRRPFFPKSQMARRPNSKDRRLVHQWNKSEVLKFIKDAKEKPYYLLSEHQYEELKAERRQKDELPPSAFVEFNKMMFLQKQKRMEC